MPDGHCWRGKFLEEVRASAHADLWQFAMDVGFPRRGKTVKAWRLHAYGDHRLEEVPMPEAAPGSVLVKVKVVQVSVVEIGLMEGMVHHHQAGISKRLAEGQPLQLGHEFCAEVVEVGPGVTTLKVGDRVCHPGGRFPCGDCPGCRAGKGCVSYMGIPATVPGAFAEYTCIPEQGLAKMPDG